MDITRDLETHRDGTKRMLERAERVAAGEADTRPVSVLFASTSLEVSKSEKTA